MRRAKLITAFFCLIFCFTQSLFGQVSEEQIAPGILYREYRLAEGPWVIQTVIIKRGLSDYELGAALGGQYVVGIEPLDKIAERYTHSGRFPLAGINGDFFILQRDPFQGDPVGLCIIDGELVSSPGTRAVFTLLDDGTPGIERFTISAKLTRSGGAGSEVTGVNQKCPENGIVLLTPTFFSETRTQQGSMQIVMEPIDTLIYFNTQCRYIVQKLLNQDSLLTFHSRQCALIGLGSGAEFIKNVTIGDTLWYSLTLEPNNRRILQAIGGGPRLLRNGQISIEASAEGIAESFVTARHPRTAVGFNSEYIFLVTVDGRQPGYSVGMSLNELAQFIKELGATESINLDGGGSTTMWMRGSIRNKPSDGSPRSIANALILYSKSPIRE